ncbi:MAG: hypothetical protein ABSF23_02625 [Terracidiphilus sp.]|jgi:hypothetical protein
MAVCELCGREIAAADGGADLTAETIEVELDGIPDGIESAGDAQNQFDVEVIDLPSGIDGDPQPTSDRDPAGSTDLCPRCHRPLAGAPRGQDVVVAEITAETEALPVEATDVDPD